MKSKQWKNYAFFIAVTEATGLLSGLITRQGTELYKTSVIKPPLSPPAIVFPIVWAILYLLMSIAASRVSLTSPSKDRRSAIYLYFLQLAFNFFWSIIFFNFEAFGFAFIWLAALWALILMTLIRFRRLDRVAGNLFVPYLAWVTFAGYLNLGVWILNR